MNMLIKALTTAALVAAASLSFAEEPGMWDKFKSYTHESKKEAVTSGEKMVAATDKQIATLKKAISTSTGEAKAAHEKNMLELQAKSKTAKAELAKMKKSAASAWDSTKDGFANAYRDLQQSYDKAAESAKSK